MSISNEQLLEMYYSMLLIRKFEDAIDLYAKKGIIPGFVHLSTGQEACHVGVVKLYANRF